MASSSRGFHHGPGDVEDAVWQLLQEVSGQCEAQGDRDFLSQLMAPVEQRLPISTPGAPFPQVRGQGRG
jgi:hypothetical protein